MKGSYILWSGFSIIIIIGMIIYVVIPNWNNPLLQSIIALIIPAYLIICTVIQLSISLARDDIRKMGLWGKINIWYWIIKLLMYINKIYKFINKIADKYLTIKKLNK